MKTETLAKSHIQIRPWGLPLGRQQGRPWLMVDIFNIILRPFAKGSSLSCAILASNPDWRCNKRLCRTNNVAIVGLEQLRSFHLCKIKLLSLLEH
jgi:hypothetical protein